MCYKDFLVKLLDKLATKGLFCKAIFATIFSAIKVYTYIPRPAGGMYYQILNPFFPPPILLS